MVNSDAPHTSAGIRREYGHTSLNEKDSLDSPLLQFDRWFSDARIHEHDDPTAMVLSTVDAQGRPDSRVVLLKGVESGHFVFYTNYASVKSHEIQTTPYVALTMYWPKMARQVRIRGPVHRVSQAQSDAYFASRPRMSQLSALASSQSEPLESRAVLEERLEALIVEYQNKVVLRPSHWGGFAVKPDEMEFWQGRNNRLHDRIHYARQGDQWIKCRLSP